MIYGFTVTNYLGESLKLVLADGEPTHGLIVKEITGLGPGKATVNISEYATSDGGQYNSARMDKRTIGITFYIVGNPEIPGCVEHARDLTYKYFPLKKRVRLIFDMDHRSAECYGYVESNEPDIFSNEETTQISIVCDDPYFYLVGHGNGQRTLFYPWDPLFEFPYENESNERVTNFGEYQLKKARILWYEGDVELGFVMTIHFLKETSGNMVVYNMRNNQAMKISIDRIKTIVGIEKFEDGDELVISTEYKNHFARFIRDGIETNIINAVDRNSDWFTLIKGKNLFVFSTDDPKDDSFYVMIENQIAYEGI